MRIPRFWHRAEGQGSKDYSFSAWGWSFKDIEEAKKNALDRLNKIVAKYNKNETLKKGYYVENPLREEIIEELKHGDNAIALLTRNRYGALVLNTGNVLFADIDFPEKKQGTMGFWKAFFATSRGWAKPEYDPQAREQAMQRVREWMGKNATKSLRIYMTAGGLRLLFTDKLYDPKSEETLAIFEQLGTDPLYVKLTSQQECFRARLTPKPWRCEYFGPPSQFPFPDKLTEEKYRRWEKEYVDVCEDYSTCKLVGQFGTKSSIPEIELVINIHDKYCLNEKAKELA